MKTNILTDREQTLADYDELGRLRGLIEFLTSMVEADITDQQRAVYARYVVDRYRQIQMARANEGVDDPATVPYTPAEEDEMERVEAARNKTGRTPHEL